MYYKYIIYLSQNLNFKKLVSRLHTVWDQFNENEKQEYRTFLKVFGALSGLFKDIEEGINANKPYLYYRNHEKLFAKVFKVQDLTRKDSAFDVIAEINNKRIGIGLKTWIHSSDRSFQKVAEFNKVAPIEIAPLIESKKYNELIYKVAELRNERIKLDKRQYNTDFDIYHNITRDDNIMNIMETSYDLIELKNLKLEKKTDTTYTFNDGINKYKFYASKSVLLKEFKVSQNNIIEQIKIKQFDDPFELLKKISLKDFSDSEKEKEEIFLPLYSDHSLKVQKKSGLNAWNAAPKTKESKKLRPDYEVYINIAKWIHEVYPNFFGFNALNRDERNNSEHFNLHFPDGRQAKAKITQDNGKSIQTNPQSFLGKWILKDTFGLEARKLVTMEDLYKFGVDSLKITKIDNNNFKIELADTYAYEQWKVDVFSNIDNSNIRKPKLRFDLFDEIKE